MHRPIRLAFLLFLPVLCFCMVYSARRPGEKGISPPAAALFQKETCDPQEEKEEPLTLPTGERLRILAVGVDNTGRLADVILYAVLDAEEKSLSVVQFPRDLYIGGEYASGKINEACLPFDSADPASRIRQILEDDFCLETDESVCVTLSGVRAAVDGLGGVTVDVPQEIDYLPGQTIPAGKQTLTGEQAEWLLRYRAGYQNADLGRIETQQRFLTAAFSRFSSVGKREALSLAAKLYGYVKTTMPLTEAASLLPEVKKLSAENVLFSTVPAYGAQYRGLSVLCMNRHRLAETLNASVLRHDPVSAWDLTVRTPPQEETSLLQEPQESPFDFSWDEEETGDDALEGIVRRR